jgi:hypothetical protein
MTIFMRKCTASTTSSILCFLMTITRMRRWALESSWLKTMTAWRSIDHRMFHQKKKKMMMRS